METFITKKGYTYIIYYISKFGQLQCQLEPEIGLKAWIKSGLIEQNDDQTDQPDEDELDSIIDDQTATPSQNMTNELLTLNLNDSGS